MPKGNKKAVSSYSIGVAAEAIAAAQFARCGFDVSVQYGANQPEYDLIVSTRDKRDDWFLKISVKGSQDGSWGLTQSYLTKGKADYHDAAEVWLRRHGPKTALCFVQFENVKFDEMPRIYLATPAEVAKRLKDTRNGQGDSILYENHTFGSRSRYAGTSERIPEEWLLSKARIDGLLARFQTGS